MLSKLISIPFILAMFYAIYITIYDNNWYSLYIIPFVVIVSLIYTFSVEIDWWWYRRNPPGIPEDGKKILEKGGLYYNKLSPEQQKLLSDRLSLFMIAKEFIDKSSEEEQLTSLITSYYPVLLTINQDNYLLEPFERFVFYNHPFPTPRIQKPHHNSELNVEDGLLIMHKGYVKEAFGEERKYFQLALYETIRIILHVHKNADLFKEDELGWPLIERIGHMKKVAIDHTIGFSLTDIKAVTIMVYLLYPIAFKENLPETYQKLKKFFGFDFL